MKKLISLLVVSSIGMLVLAGCSGGGDSTDANAGGTATGAPKADTTKKDDATAPKTDATATGGDMKKDDATAPKTDATAPGGDMKKDDKAGGDMKKDDKAGGDMKKDDKAGDMKKDDAKK